jgi:hypothetical protein
MVMVRSEGSQSCFGLGDGDGYARATLILACGTCLREGISEQLGRGAPPGQFRGKGISLSSAVLRVCTTLSLRALLQRFAWSFSDDA